ncbi:MAG: threonine synthase [Acidobacteria bacterium]|nr:threonine synthase [Acidobacteriota bacterium]
MSHVGRGSLRCCRCSKTTDSDQRVGLCGCGGTLVYEPDLDAARGLDPDDIARIGPGPRTLSSLLPEQSCFLTLGEGNTPLRAAPSLGQAVGITDLWLKDEIANPSGSFKDRGMALAIGMARARSAPSLALATAGNAGVSAALYSRAAGFDLYVVMPEITPPVFAHRARAWGARVEMGGADLAQAGALLRERIAGQERFDLSTLREPYRVEGKKLIGYEVILGLRRRVPDWIVLPTGGGTAVIGVDKALTEMEKLGWLQGTPPRLACVQAAGCAPVVRAFENRQAVTSAWEKPETGAWGLRVPAPLGGSRILDALKRRSGIAVSVEDEDIIQGARELWGLERVPAGPEGGASVAGVRTLLKRGVIRFDQCVVLLITGGSPVGVDSPLGLE